MITSKSANNIFYRRNVPISNSLILNNFSIQNVIISPSKFVNNINIPVFSNNLYTKSPYVYTQSPKKVHQNIYNNIQYIIPRKINFQNIVPLTSYKSEKKLNNYNSKLFHQNPLHTSPSYNNLIKSQEKHPQDSIKPKINNKNAQILLKNDKFILKSSSSQKLLRPISNTLANINNLNLTQNFASPKKISENNILHKYVTIKENNNLSEKKNLTLEPKGIINLSEYQLTKQIGKGSYGKIFCVKWKKNNKLYALKQEILTDMESIQKRKEAWKIIQNFKKSTQCTGLINIYANLLLKNNYGLEYQYYELMEKAERDWDQEINVRSQYNLFYKESELLNIMKQITSTLVAMQKSHITHRDIKPQNILIINGKYKLCDFGEIRVLKRNGLIVQRVRGSELYMSPILFKGLHSNSNQVKHNTYKSDVFSLGMCFFYAASLTYNSVDSIRELNNMNQIRAILFKYLEKKYSEKFILLILSMLEVNEENRPDFIELEKKLKETFKI